MHLLRRRRLFLSFLLLGCLRLPLEPLLDRVLFARAIVPTVHEATTSQTGRAKGNARNE